MLECVCNPRTVNRDYPTIEMELSGFIFKFEPRFYLMTQKQTSRTQMCDVTILKEPRNPYFMLLGDSFLRAYFTVYKVDERKIGLLSVTSPKRPRKVRKRRSSKWSKFSNWLNS